MKTGILLILLSLTSFLGSAARADSVSGMLTQQSGYVGIESKHGFFAFDRVTNAELILKLRNCMGRHSTAEYNDRGMIDELINVKCNQ